MTIEKPNGRRNPDLSYLLASATILGFINTTTFPQLANAASSSCKPIEGQSANEAIVRIDNSKSFTLAGLIEYLKTKNAVIPQTEINKIKTVPTGKFVYCKIGTVEILARQGLDNQLDIRLLHTKKQRM